MAGPRSRFLIFALIGCSAVAAAAQSERETAWRPSWRSMRFEPPRFGSHPVNGAASATLPPAAAGGGVAGIDECAYVLDDGTGENGIGVLSGGTTTWFNRFDQKSGCAVVTAIQVAWDSGGFLPPGVPAKVFLYEDPNDDGDPSDVTGAQLRALVQVTTANEDTDIFNDYPIPPTLVSGSFFVGATIANGAGEFPARLDQSSSALSSWLSSNPSNPNDPVGTGTAPILVDTIGLPGNLMVRAVGAPVEASCAGDTNADGLVNVSDLVNVIIDWGSDGSANGGNVIDEGPSAGVVDVTDLLQIILDWGPCALGAPPNDQCLSAIDLSLPGFAFGQTITATADPEAFPCGGPVGAPGTWYRVIGTGQSLTASLCDAATDYDTTIHVYCGPCGSLRCIGGDDDGCPSASLKSTFSWCSAAGQEYLILVSGFSGETGSYQLTVAADGSCAPSSPCIDPPDTPVNDECADAIVITEGLVPFTTVNATTDGPDHPQCANQFDQGATPRDVWFLYTATMDGVLLLSTCEDLGGSATFDTDLVVYDPSLVAGSVCDNLEDALLGCNDDDPDNPCGGPPPDGGWQSTLYVPVVQGQPYLIRVGSGSTGGEGTGQLLVQSLPDGSDICSLALNIEPGQTVQLDTCTASPDPDVPVCGALPPDRPGRWLKTVGNGSQYTVTLCNLGFGAWNSRLLVYCGPCDDLVCAGGEPNNNSGCAPFTEKLTWCTEPGGEYYILVHGQANPGCGVIDVQLTSGAACSEPPCEQPLGACCVEGECVSNTSSANCVALNGQWYGDGSACNALPTACRLPGGSCSGQNPTSPLGNWTFVPADLGAGFVGYDDFAWSGGQITALRFWGVDIFPQLGFIDCNESADGLVQFRVRIHANSGGQPGAVVFDAGVLSASRSPDGTFFDGFERNEYNIDLSSTPASLAAGTYWLSLAGADDDDDCWFYWSNSPTGGNNAVQEDVLTGPPFDPLSLNLSFCVNP